MDEKKIERIIAREGLIIFGIMVISVILIWISVPTGHHYEYFSTIGLKNPYPFFDNRIFALMFAIGIRLSFFGYPAYLLIRFIIWAIKTLKQKG